MPAVAILIALCCAVGVREVRAASDCPESGRGWVELSFLGNHEPALEDRIEQHLRVELLRGNLDVCASSPDRRTLPQAHLQIEFLDARQTELRMWVSDSIAETRMGRRLSLARLPDDAHAMAVALGMVELLQAVSASRSQPEPNHDVTGHQALRGGLELRLGGEAFMGGLRQFGVDGALVVQIGSRFGVVTRAGKRLRSTVTSNHGDVDVDGVVLGVKGRFVLLRPGPRLDLALDGSLDAEWLSIESHPRPGHAGRAVTERIEWASLGLASTLHLTKSFWMTMGACSGWVLSPLRLTDGGAHVVGAHRMMVGTEVGIGAHF